MTQNKFNRSFVLFVHGTLCIHVASRKRATEDDYLVASLRYAMRFALSAGFLRPANTILVPGMYFLGLSR